MPLVPDVPLVPEVPEVPLVPDVPDVPEVPLVPLVPEVPDVPLVPEVPEVPSELCIRAIVKYPNILGEVVPGLVAFGVLEESGVSANFNLKPAPLSSLTIVEKLRYGPSGLFDTMKKSPTWASGLSPFESVIDTSIEWLMGATLPPVTLSHTSVCFTLPVIRNVPLGPLLAIVSFGREEVNCGSPKP